MARAVFTIFPPSRRDWRKSTAGGDFRLGTMSIHLVKLVSRFAMPKSEEARLDALASPSSFAGVHESDPKSVARFMKKMGCEMGEDLGDDFDQALERN